MVSTLNSQPWDTRHRCGQYHVWPPFDFPTHDGFFTLSRLEGKVQIMIQPEPGFEPADDNETNSKIIKHMIMKIIMKMITAMNSFPRTGIHHCEKYKVLSKSTRGSY